jgi:hypothetical protein
MRAIWLFWACTNLVTAAAAPREDQILLQGNVQGKQTVSATGANAATAEYSYNDRGRGDHIIAT